MFYDCLRYMTKISTVVGIEYIYESPSETKKSSQNLSETFSVLLRDFLKTPNRPVT